MDARTFVPWRLQPLWWWVRDVPWHVRGRVHSQHWRDERDRNTHRKRTLEGSEHLNGACLRWTTWRPHPAIAVDVNGVESPSFWTHDHCHFCYMVGFSDSYDVDRRQGWTTTDGESDYVYWICPDCFELFRDRHGWTVESTSSAQ